MADPTVKLSQFSGFLPKHIADAYFEDAAKISVAQRIMRQVPLAVAGESIPVVTSKMTASWVAEGARKPASQGTLGLETMEPKKLAAIAVVSAEVVRANPGNYMALIRPQIAEAFATAFDAAVFHGTSTPFDAYLDQSTKAAEIGAHTASEGGVWQDLNTALRLLVEDDRVLTGWAIDDVVEPALNGSVDANGRPIFVELPPGTDTAAQAQGDFLSSAPRIGRLMGRPSIMGSGVATANYSTVVGYGGDWRKCAWGSVGGISYDISTQATVTLDGTLTSLWEHNLVAIRAEAEFGFVCPDPDAFVRLTNLAGS